MILAVETVRKLGKNFAVIINRYGIGNDEVEKYCDIEKISIAAKIPNSRKVAELYSAGELLIDKVPEFSEQIKIIEDFIFKIKD